MLNRPNPNFLFSLIYLAMEVDILCGGSRTETFSRSWGASVLIYFMNSLVVGKVDWEIISPGVLLCRVGCVKGPFR